MREPMLKVRIPEGKAGAWSVKRFKVSLKQAHRWNVGCKGRRIIPGEYTGLYHNGEIIMSDTPSEMDDHKAALVAARGHVLINGLGIGMFLLNCVEKLAVDHVTVVEISAEVLQLVGPWYQDKYGDKITFVHADALEYKPLRGTRFDFVWHDIWPTISANNWPSMVTLHRRYGKRCNNQKSWCRDEVISLVEEDRRRAEERREFEALFNRTRRAEGA